MRTCGAFFLCAIAPSRALAAHRTRGDRRRFSRNAMPGSSQSFCNCICPNCLSSVSDMNHSPGISESAFNERKFMQRLLMLAALVVSTSVFAHDVDPFGFEKQDFDAPASKARAQVAAETREAARLGLLRDSLFGPVQAR